MKKLIAVAMAVLMAFVLLAGCGGKTPAEQYQVVLDKAKEEANTSADIAMDVVIGVTTQGMSMDITMDSAFAVDLTDEAKPLMSANVNMNIPGAGTNAMKFYYDGSYVYMDVGDGMKFKTAMSAEEAKALMNQQNAGALADAATLKDLTVETVDGNRVFSYTMDEAAAQASINTILSEALGELDEASFTIKEFSGTTTVDKNDRAKAATVHAVLTFTVSGQTMDMVMDMNTKVNATGDSVKVEVPADLDSYIAVDDGSLAA